MLSAVPRRSFVDVIIGHLKWLLLLVASLLFIWIPQALLLLLGATIGCEHWHQTAVHINSARRCVP